MQTRFFLYLILHCYIFLIVKKIHQLNEIHLHRTFIIIFKKKTSITFVLEIFFQTKGTFHVRWYWSRKSFKWLCISFSSYPDSMLKINCLNYSILPQDAFNPEWSSTKVFSTKWTKMNSFFRQHICFIWLG